MDYDQTRIQELLSRLAESLNVEVKRWIDPDAPPGIAKIARASLALRNRNGGSLVIGFDDKTLQPDKGNEPKDVRSTFHTDKIQSIVSRYSSELFEIAVAYGERDGQEYPVIIIPEGVRTPVAAKVDLYDDQSKLLVRLGEVYFRTLAANGTPSTAPARPQDWRDIVEICFDNREADIGRFLRRQLAGRDMSSLISTLSQFGLSHNVPSAPTLRECAEALLNDGDQRFQKAIKGRALTADEQALVNAGTWSIALVLDPPRAARVPDQTFLTTFASSNPNYTGWPIWVDSSTFRDRSHAPIVKDKAWEALILSIAGWSPHLDFSRVDPKGEFFLRRNIPDDSNKDRVTPGTVLDPILVLIRLAEAIAVGLAFTKALGWEEGTTRLGFAFKWTKLKSRELVSWANFLTHISDGYVAHDDEIITYTELPLDTPISAIAPFVEEATRDLFALFGGYKMPTEATETWVQKLIERRLGR